MLVLTRKRQESVVVGGSAAFARLLRITVLEINGGKVKLGFDIDADIPVHRLEVWEQIAAGPTATRPSQPARTANNSTADALERPAESHTVDPTALTVVTMPSLPS